MYCYIKIPGLCELYWQLYLIILPLSPGLGDLVQDRVEFKAAQCATKILYRTTLGARWYIRGFQHPAYCLLWMLCVLKLRSSWYAPPKHRKMMMIIIKGSITARRAGCKANRLRSSTYWCQTAWLLRSPLRCSTWMSFSPSSIVQK